MKPSPKDTDMAKRRYTIEVIRARDGKCYYRIRYGDDILSRSQRYARPYNARRAALAVCKRDGHKYVDLTRK